MDEKLTRPPGIEGPPLYVLEGDEPEWTAVDAQFFKARGLPLRFVEGRGSFWLVYSLNGERRVRRFTHLQWIPIPVSIANAPKIVP